MNFNLWFKTKSWQSVLAADMHAAIMRKESAGEERRINLIDYEGTLEHVLMSIGARSTRQQHGRRHLITGASARVSLRAAPDIQLNAGISNFWQRRHGSQAEAPDALAALARQRAHKEGSAGA